MKKILIIEDEKPAARRLVSLLQQCVPGWEILEILDSVKGSVEWLHNLSAARNQPGSTSPDVIFMDIQLADGLSFDIFSKVNIEVPVIFTTAYDEYALKAFKVNSIDYLLKPIEKEELQQAIQKFERLTQPSVSYNQQTFEKMLQAIAGKKYKERFLVKIGTQLIQVPVAEIAYFYAADRMVFAHCHDKKRHAIDYTLDQLEDMVNPNDYFRISRKALLHHGAIQKIHNYQNRRLILELEPRVDGEVLVSRERVGSFKDWLDR
ncbi:MAG: LytR/AlgR family response regulator transcription factor [Saprospiraceae bacterium]